MGGDRRSEQRARAAGSRRQLANQLAQLAWLDGFPHDGRWHRLDTGESIAIDGQLLARSRRAAQTALREHRAALAEQVGDVDRWWLLVDTVLRWSSAPHGVLDLLDHAPRRVARQARALADRPDIGAAAIAAGVAWAHQPRQLASAIDWLAGCGALIDDVPTTLALAKLAGHAPDGVAAWIALAAIDAPHPQTAVEYVAHLRARLRGNTSASAGPAGPRSGHHARTWLAQLLRRAPDVQHRALGLLATSGLTDALVPWQDWERAHAERLARAAAFAARAFDDKREAAGRQRLVDLLQQISKAAPAEVVIAEALAAIDLLAESARREFPLAAIRLFGAFAGNAPHVRVHLLLHAAAVVYRAEHARVAWLWDALADALAAGASPRLLAPWRERAAKGHYYARLDDDLVEELPRRAACVQLVDALGRIAAHGWLAEADAERAGLWIAAGVSAENTAELVISLRDTAGDLADGLAGALVRLSDGTPGDAAALARSVLPIAAQLDYVERSRLVPLLVHAANSGAAWLVRAAFAGGHGRALVDAAQVLAVVPRPRWPALVTVRRPPWIAHYPGALRDALGRLAAVDPDARTTAAGRLADDLPDPDELRREIANLAARPALTASQARRLANLERRLASPRQPSAARLVRLADKLDRTAIAIGIQRFVAEVTSAADERLARLLPGCPGHMLLDRKTREIALALTKLDDVDRTLAARLLRARSGAKPWDLRDESANAAFLDHMRTAGLDPAPWLDSAPTTVVAADGRPLELALCDDPLEVFAMGAHFSTCLSPDGINFFSVIANAADINKRVLYARRGGSVVGRCLLAVTDGFGLLTFNPYCHDGAIRFVDVARAFAVELAARMQTRVVPRGTVKTLLARDWYDDGPVDLVGRFRGLDDRALDLDRIAPDQLLDRLRAALDHEVDETTLPLVLGLPALRTRPALLAPLVPALLAARSPATRIAAMMLAADVGDLVLADRLLGDHADVVQLEPTAWPLGHVLAQLRPSYTLTRLRKTRWRSVRSWHDERNDRQAVAAVALEALHRPRKAIELYELALADRPYFEDDLRPRLDRLRAQL